MTEIKKTRKRELNIPKALEERYGKSHLSYSSIKHALTDMRLFDLYMRGQLRKESDALNFGSLYDMMLFEPERVRSNYYVMDENEIISSLSDKAKNAANPKLTKEYKELKEVYSSNAKEKGLTMVDKSDYDKSAEMIERLKKCGLYDTFLEGNKFQVEFNEVMVLENDGEELGVRVKGFLDCLGKEYILDSKSTRSMSKFKYDVNSFCYDIQAYIYCTVFDIDEYYWLVQEKAYPFYPGIVKCSQETLFNGEMKFHQAITRIETFLMRAQDDSYDFSRDFAEFSV
mgnify:CR=1 FL=1|jgi:hypothetical protein|tara:strand:- start:1298 stop:2152 length:855 start_codon:yes stop_codon:yes gene_type:complete